MLIETASNEATGVVEESSHQRPKDSQWSSFIDTIINKKPDSENGMIQPFKTSAMSDVTKKIFNNSLVRKEPAEEILPDHETAKNLSVTLPKSEGSSEYES